MIHKIEKVPRKVKASQKKDRHRERDRSASREIEERRDPSDVSR